MGNWIVMTRDPQAVVDGGAPSDRDDDASVEAGGLSVLGLLNLVLRSRRLLAACAVAGAVVGLTVAVLSAPRYQASSRLMTQVRSTPMSGLGGLAAQFGIEVTQAPAEGSVLFYVEFLRSRELLRSVVLREYDVTIEGSSLRRTLVDLYEIDPDLPEERRQRLAILRLNDNVGLLPDSRLGLLGLRTTTPWPEVSVQVNEAMLELLNEFNIRRRQTQAQREREFVEGRLTEVEGELQEAEQALEAFLVQNRSYQNSPQLVFEAARLERQIQNKQQVVISLAQSLEQARIDELRNTPAVTVWESPQRSVVNVSRQPIRSGLVAAILGLVAGILFVFARTLFAHLGQSRPADYGEFVDLKQELLSDLNPLNWRRRNAWRRHVPGEGSSGRVETPSEPASPTARVD